MQLHIDAVIPCNNNAMILYDSMIFYDCFPSSEVRHAPLNRMDLSISSQPGHARPKTRMGQEGAGGNPE